MNAEFSARSAKFFQPDPNPTKPDQGKPKKTKKKILGFPWIPSSESGLFKGLRRFQTKIFLAPFRLTQPVPQVAVRSGDRKPL
jgi:hypothetical protein